MRNRDFIIIIGVIIAFLIGGCLGYHAGDRGEKTIRKTDTVFVKYPIVQVLPSKPINFYIPVEKRIYSIDTIFQKNNMLEQAIIIRDTIDSSGIVSRLAEFNGLQLIPEVRKTTIKGAPLLSIYAGANVVTNNETLIDFGPSATIVYKGRLSFGYNYSLFQKHHNIAIGKRIR